MAMLPAICLAMCEVYGAMWLLRVIIRRKAIDSPIRPAGQPHFWSGGGKWCTTS